MASYSEIPIQREEYRFEIRTSIDDVEYVLFFYWLERQERWCMDIKDANGDDLTLGIVLNVDRELIRQYTIEGMPSGMLFLMDMTDAHEECGIDELGDRCKLIYVSDI